MNKKRGIRIGNLRIFSLFLVIMFSLVFMSSSIMDLTFNSSDDIIFNNRTEVSSHGVCSETPALFMDFNKEAEGTYFQDNNYWTREGEILDD